MKVSVSGWPGGGSSTLSLMLCKMLGLKHVRGSETFRMLYKMLSFSDTGTEHLEAHRLVEPHFGPIYDKFIDLILSSGEYDNILVESDIASFRVGKIPNLFSIFLTTDINERKKRMGVDGRSEDGDELENIDKNHEHTYKELHDINWFNVDEIITKHQLVFDNTKTAIKAELDLIFESMLKKGFFNIDEFNKLISETSQEEQNFNDEGKKFYTDFLSKHNMVMTPEEILEVIKQKFPSEIQNLPENLKKVILDR